MVHFPDAVGKEALRERQDLEAWQKRKIEQTIQRADRGDGKYYTYDEVKSHLDSLNRDYAVA